MARFIAVWRQDNGCDYTIGCGIAVHHFEAADLAAAKLYVVGQLSSLGLHDEIADSMAQVDIIEYVGNFPACTMMPGTWKIEREVAKQRQAELDNPERKEYERLKKKFGGVMGATKSVEKKP